MKNLTNFKEFIEEGYSSYRREVYDEPNSIIIGHIYSYIDPKTKKLVKVEATKNNARELAKLFGLDESAVEINEGLTDVQMRINHDLTLFLQNVIEKSKGYVKNERDAALILFDILKNTYKIR